MADIPRFAPSPAFEDPDELELVWGAPWGSRSEIGRLRTALVGEGADGSLAAALEAEDVMIVPLAAGAESPALPRDLVVAVAGGAIVTRPANPEVRRRLPDASRAVAAAGCPILQTVSGMGILEGGNLVWLGDRLLALGLNARGNEAAAAQLDPLLAGCGVELLRVPLPGMAARLEDLLAPIDTDLVFCDARLLPWFVVERLQAEGMRPVTPRPGQGDVIRNTLVLRPGRLLMETGTAERIGDQLDRAGIDIVPLSCWPADPDFSLRRAVAPLQRDPI